MQREYDDPLRSLYNSTNLQAGVRDATMSDASDFDDVERHRVQTHRHELMAQMMRLVPMDGAIELLKGVRLHRVTAPTMLRPAMFTPALFVIAQGSKEVYLGSERYRYAPLSLLLFDFLPIREH